MPKVTFFLKDKNSKEETLVYLVFQFNRKVLKYSFGEKIKPKFWNEKTYRAKVTRQFPGHVEFNNLLDSLDSCVNDTYRNLVSNSVEPTIEKIKAGLKVFLKKDTNEDHIPLNDFIESYIKTSSYKYNTIKQYKTAFKQLKEYQIDRKVSIDFGDVNLDFYNDFNKYLIERNYSLNSIGTILKNIKVFMNEAVERGLTKNLDFRNKRFKTFSENTEGIYLSIADLNKIAKLDLADNPRLDKVRDLFLIGCYTGLRFSDLTKLKEENFIQNGSQAKIKTEKTGQIVVIPLNSIVREILNKYDGVPPNAISNQKMNAYLKEIGILAEIDEEFLFTLTKGGKNQSKSFKKYELITVHTARRSFATNAFLNNVPSISIMKITGHRTENAFMKYIKISQEDNANKLIEHPFFK